MGDFRETDIGLSLLESDVNNGLVMSVTKQGPFVVDRDCFLLSSSSSIIWSNLSLRKLAVAVLRILPAEELLRFIGAPFDLMIT